MQYLKNNIEIESRDVIKCIERAGPKLDEPPRFCSFPLLPGHVRPSTVGKGQEVCFGLSRPDAGRNAQEQDGTRTGRNGPHLGTWMGSKCCKTKHMVNLDGTPSDLGWDLDRPPGSDPGEGLDEDCFMFLHVFSV